MIDFAPITPIYVGVGIVFFIGLVIYVIWELADQNRY